MFTRKLARLGQLHTICSPVEQRLSKFPLQFRDLPADGRGRNMEAIRS